MTINDEPSILQKLAENEEAVAVLYKEYARRFPEFVSFWTILVDEEKEHANWIRKLQIVAKEGKLSVKQGRFNKEALLAYNNYLQRELAKVIKGETNLMNALSVTLYIEESLIESKFFDVFETDSLELKNVLKSLDSATRVHLAKAREVLTKHKRLSAIQ